MASDTLRVLHLPAHLSDERREELFKNYGATKTKTFRSSDTYATTFVKFSNKEAAVDAFLQLHQLEIGGKYLSINFAKKSLFDDNAGRGSSAKEIKKHETCDDEKNKDCLHFQAFLKKLNSWASNELFTQPPHPNLWYKYSLPTKNTLQRIVIQLMKEPAFYTQVLHLMNRMNLPPPFEELEEEFPILKEAYEVEKYRDLLAHFGNDRDETILSEESEESEIELEEETNRNPVLNLPIKRKRQQPRRQLKMKKFANFTKKMSTTMSKVIRPEDAFESVQCETKTRKIELKPVEKLEKSVRHETNKNSNEIEGGFGLMFPAKKDEDGEEDSDEQKTKKEQEKDYITTEELEANKISTNDQRVLPVFKNYHAGKPSCRLYIKNLSKQVDIKDLHFIYRRYVNERLDNLESRYDVRLMQEGRMKGQAFVTLQNIGQAQLALNETNGYILKDKPIVVQFAKATTG